MLNRDTWIDNLIVFRPIDSSVLKLNLMPAIYQGDKRNDRRSGNLKFLRSFKLIRWVIQSKLFGGFSDRAERLVGHVLDAGVMCSSPSSNIAYWYVQVVWGAGMKYYSEKSKMQATYWVMWLGERCNTRWRKALKQISAIIVSLLHRSLGLFSSHPGSYYTDQLYGCIQ